MHKGEKGMLVMTPRTTSEMFTGRWGWPFAPARDSLSPFQSADLYRAFCFLGREQRAPHL